MTTRAADIGAAPSKLARLPWILLAVTVVCVCVTVPLSLGHTRASFSSRLRVEVDLDAARGGVCAVVRSTMQPTHVSLWLHESERT